MKRRWDEINPILERVSNESKKKDKSSTVHDSAFSSLDWEDFAAVKVCIVQAKKDDMQKGQIQCLIGCEVIAELEKISIVYGIVTNYIEWSFYKSTDDN
eukprot:gene12712-17048_t